MLEEVGDEVNQEESYHSQELQAQAVILEPVMIETSHAPEDE